MCCAEPVALHVTLGYGQIGQGVQKKLTLHFRLGTTSQLNREPLCPWPRQCTRIAPQDSVEACVTLPWAKHWGRSKEMQDLAALL